MNNPVIDQDRFEHLNAKLSATDRKALLPAWSRHEKELPLVELDVRWVRFSTLNHRTKAEQMRLSSRQGQLDLFSNDPLGDHAQQLQYDILRAQHGFEDLKADLQERGQQEPAVVTCEGVLINGNRRSAALRALYLDEQHMPSRNVRCLVLPHDATVDEIVDLETELQIARDFREDYSWVNEALLIEEIFNREDQNWDRVASRMHMDVPSVRAQFEKLQQLHQLVALSGGSKFHADFSENQSAFGELANHIRGKTSVEANSVREAYFLGTLAGVEYRTLRHLRRDDAAALIRKELEEDPAIGALINDIGHGCQEVGGDILDDVLGDPSDKNSDLSGVLSFIAEKGRDEVVELPTGTTLAVDDLIGSVNAAVNAAAQEANEENRDNRNLNAPINRLSSAIDHVRRAGSLLEKARVIADWQEDDFRRKIDELEAEIAELKSL